jgi:hypothetical protein
VAARTAENRVAELRRQVPDLERRVQDLDRARLEAALSTARRAALAAFESQGPRLARVLEAFSKAAPGEVAVTSLKATAQGPIWLVQVKGEVQASNPALAQAAFNTFLHEAEATPYLGEVAKPPIIRVAAPVEPANPPAPVLTAAGAAGAEPSAYATAPPGISADDWLRYPEDIRGLFRRWGAWDGDDARRIRPFEDHWLRHPVPDKEYFDWIRENEDYARNRSARRAAAAAPVVAAALPAGPPPAAMTFSIEFEVQK